MLTSLGKMKLDRIYSMLKMFATPGAGGKEISEVLVILSVRVLTPTL